MKSEVFSKELNYINDNNIKNSAKTMLDLLPDYFYKIGASSTGKYHPSFSLGDGGLVKHTKAAVRIAVELLNNSSLQSFTSKEKDLMIFALLIHDGLKNGINKNEYTQFEHPLLISNYLNENKNKLYLNDEEIKFISNCLETHMGPWTKDYNGNEILRSPLSKYERFVHMCDYLSSRKFLNISFEDNEIVN